MSAIEAIMKIVNDSIFNFCFFILPSHIQDLEGALRKYVNTTALAVNNAQSQKAMLNVPVISARYPATAGPVI